MVTPGLLLSTGCLLFSVSLITSAGMILNFCYKIQPWVIKYHREMVVGEYIGAILL